MNGVHNLACQIILLKLNIQPRRLLQRVAYSMIRSSRNIWYTLSQVPSTFQQKTSSMAAKSAEASVTASLKILNDQESSFCKLEKLEQGIYLLQFAGESEHRFTPASIQLIDNLLDQVLRDETARVLITMNQGKYYSTGMDVDYMRKHGKKIATEYVFKFQRLVSKLLTFCIPTIAVIRGHAVGAGCIFALAHDYRIMISSRAYIFLSEVNLGLSLTPGNVAVLASKLQNSVFQEAVLTGKKYNGDSAAAAGFVQEKCPEGPTLLERGKCIAAKYKSKKWRREIYQALKKEMFRKTVKELETGGLGYARM